MYNLKDIERQTITKVFKEYPHETLLWKADLLGISERTLYRKIKTYGLKDLEADIIFEEQKPDIEAMKKELRAKGYGF